MFKNKRQKAIKTPANKMVPASQNKAEHGEKPAVPIKPDKVYCSACGHLGKIGEGQCRHPRNVIDAPWVPGRKIYPPTKPLNENGGCKDFEKHIIQAGQAGRSLGSLKGALKP